MLRNAFEVLDNKTEIVDVLGQNYKTGRKGYPKDKMVKAVLGMYMLGMAYMNTMYKALQDNIELRELCGFTVLPHRTTFNRFESKLADYSETFNDAITQIVEELHDIFPDLGERVAVDSTALFTYSNGSREPVSDPEAQWGYKNSSKTKGGKAEMYFGYKGHMITDVKHGIPLAVTTGPTGGLDYDWLEPMVLQAQDAFDWFAPEAVIADRGYDKTDNFTFLWDQGIHPIIKIRDMSAAGRKPNPDKPPARKKRKTKTKLNVDGVPSCPEDKLMDFVMTDSRGWHLYECGTCSHEIWLDPMTDIRKIGTIRRASDKFQDMYRERYAVERPFKSMKQSRRLEHHTRRGAKKIHIHMLLSTFAYLATVLSNYWYRPSEYLLWMVPRVA